jgi:hypothetical protein
MLAVSACYGRAAYDPYDPADRALMADRPGSGVA